MSCCFWATFINSAGLVFDIVCVVLLFRYALPEEVSRKGTRAVLWWWSTDPDKERTNDEEQKKKAAR